MHSSIITQSSVIILVCLKINALVIGIAGDQVRAKRRLPKRFWMKLGLKRLLLPHDAYYRNQDHLTFEERVKVNYDHPDSLETELLIKHLKALIAGQAIQMPIYDFKLHSRSKETKIIQPRSIILVEGILILYEKVLRQYFDVKLFVDADPDIRFIRRLEWTLPKEGVLLNR